MLNFSFSLTVLKNVEKIFVGEVATVKEALLALEPDALEIISALEPPHYSALLVQDARDHAHAADHVFADKAVKHWCGGERERGRSYRRSLLLSRIIILQLYVIDQFSAVSGNRATYYFLFRPLVSVYSFVTGPT